MKCVLLTQIDLTKPKRVILVRACVWGVLSPLAVLAHRHWIYGVFVYGCEYDEKQINGHEEDADSLLQTPSVHSYRADKDNHGREQRN